jgi:hypothetical protein
LLVRPTLGSRRLFPKLPAVPSLSLARTTASCVLVGLLISLLTLSPPAKAASSTACELSVSIRAELPKTQDGAIAPSDFDKNVAPLLALRQRHPNDLPVHVLYQDAVESHGIEGHLRKLTEEYQVLSMQHPDDPMYDYLYARSLIGRNTPSAIKQINELLAQHPDFAQGHGSLAAIYASAAFRDDEKGKLERERFLQLCPGSAVQTLPGPLPEPSPLLDQAEELLARNGDPDRVTAMAQQGIRDDEWRLQRIRPFDWYTVEFKRQSQRDLQIKYWEMWSIEVRGDRRAGRSDKVAALLASMEQRAEPLGRLSDPAYWDASTVLVRLYEEGNQADLAGQRLASMRKFLTEHPDIHHAAQLEELKKEVIKNK